MGDDNLLVRRDHLVLGHLERPLGGTWTGDAGDVTEALAVAAEAVKTRRRRHGEGPAGLELITAGDDDLDAGIAAALLDDDATAHRRLAGAVHPAHLSIATEYV